MVDDIGFVKKGAHSVGVIRQYSGTIGRIESCQIGVFLSYASRYGQSLIDRRLYLPKEWAEDTGLQTKTQIPTDTAFATKPAIACDLIVTTHDAGVPCAWVPADGKPTPSAAFRSSGRAYIGYEPVLTPVLVPVLRTSPWLGLR